MQELLRFQSIAHLWARAYFLSMKIISGFKRILKRSKIMTKQIKKERVTK